MVTNAGHTLAAVTIVGRVSALCLSGSLQSLTTRSSGVLLGLVWVLTLASCAKPTNAPPTTPTVDVKTIVAEISEAPVSVELPGRVVASMTAEIRPQVSGIVQQRLFEEGAEVEAGQRLYRIEPSSYQATRNNALASVAKARATHASAEAKLQRYRALAASSLVSRQDEDDLVALEGQSKAELQGAEALLASADLDLRRTWIEAPIAGRIGPSQVTPGALVSAYQATALATVLQIDPVYVDVVQSSNALLDLRLAMTNGALRGPAGGPAQVQLKLQDGRPYAHQGALEFIGASVGEDTGNVKLRIRVSNPDRLLLPGMYLRAHLVAAVNTRAILLPQRAVTHDAQGDAHVMVVDQVGVARKRKIAITSMSGNHWIVTDGLAAGEQVVTEGLQKVRDGAVVRVVRESPATGAASGSVVP